MAAEAFDNPDFARLNAGGICGALHPTEAGIVCEVPAEKCYERHQAVHVDLLTGVRDLSWPNPRMLPPKMTDKKTVKDMADRVEGSSSLPRTADTGRDLGEQAYLRTTEAWKESGRLVVMGLCAEMDEFSGNDIWRAGLSVPFDANGIENRRAIWGVLSRLRSEGWIENTGRKIKGDYANGNDISIWKVMRRPETVSVSAAPVTAPVVLRNFD